MVALEQLAKSRHKRPEGGCHVFVYQHLLWQEEWRRRFEKEMNVWFLLLPGLAWVHDLYEPLVVGFSFPLRRFPWLSYCSMKISTWSIGERVFSFSNLMELILFFLGDPPL